jgi:riboflavin kinase/FMN adenylyltransferase
MRIIRGLDGGARGASAALGNFDGLHLGHRALIGAAREAAPWAPLAVVTFEPHPRRFFQPDAPPFRLTTAAERARILRGIGVDVVAELPFDARLAAMSAEDFAGEVLAGGLGLAHVTVGEDFRFGHRRAGDAAMLRRLGGEHGFGVTILHPVAGGEGVYSSTAVRVMVEQGRMREAAEALGRWHSVSGRVQQGDRRGRELGFPTANLEFGEQIAPRFGVYAARVTVHDGPHRGTHDGVASIGVRPQFGVNAPNFEVHLFDFAGDLYGAEISAGLVTFLRDEARFDGVDTLVAQMTADCAAARAALAAARAPGE